MSPPGSHFRVDVETASSPFCDFKGLNSSDLMAQLAKSCFQESSLVS